MEVICPYWDRLNRPHFYLNEYAMISFVSGFFFACKFLELIYKFYHHADLVPVSSTVFPETDMPNKDEITAEMDKQYKKAYFSLFKKKFNANLEKPDTLMTHKKKFVKSEEKQKSR